MTIYDEISTVAKDKTVKEVKDLLSSYKGNDITDVIKVAISSCALHNNPKESILIFKYLSIQPEIDAESLEKALKGIRAKSEKEGIQHQPRSLRSLFGGSGSSSKSFGSSLDISDSSELSQVKPDFDPVIKFLGNKITEMHKQKESRTISQEQKVLRDFVDKSVKSLIEKSGNVTKEDIMHIILAATKELINKTGSELDEKSLNSKQKELEESLLKPIYVDLLRKLNLYIKREYTDETFYGHGKVPENANTDLYGNLMDNFLSTLCSQITSASKFLNSFVILNSLIIADNKNRGVQLKSDFVNAVAEALSTKKDDENFPLKDIELYVEKILEKYPYALAGHLNSQNPAPAIALIVEYIQENKGILPDAEKFILDNKEKLANLEIKALEFFTAIQEVNLIEVVTKGDSKIQEVLGEKSYIEFMTDKMDKAEKSLHPTSPLSRRNATKQKSVERLYDKTAKEVRQQINSVEQDTEQLPSSSTISIENIAKQLQATVSQNSQDT